MSWENVMEHMINYITYTIASMSCHNKVEALVVMIKVQGVSFSDLL